MLKRTSIWTGILIIGMMNVFFVFSLFAQSGALKVAWDPNTESDLAGYKVYHGVASRNYTSVIDVGNVTQYTVNNLNYGTTYFFAVTAYDLAGNESDYSEEVSGHLDPQDTEAPQVTSVTIKDLTHIDVTFSEPVTKLTAEDAENYKINNNIQLVSAVLNNDGKTVHLTTTAHQYNTQYTITINNIQDLATPPNTIAANTTRNYSLQQQDTTPPTIIHAKLLDLSLLEVKFSEPVTKESAEEKANYAISQGIQILNVIQLADLQTVHLTTSSHQRGINYVIRINHVKDRSPNANEIAPNSEATYQSVDSDTEPPQIAKASALNKTQIKIEFSEAISKASAENANNYHISDGVNVLTSLLNADLKSVTLQTTEHEVNKEYTITINNVQDRASPPNTIAANSTATYTIFQADTEPPRISSLQKHDLTKLEVIFTKPVEKTSAENIANYQISNNVQVKYATLRDNALSVLLLTSEHTRNVTYTITINNIKDKATPPNTIPENSTFNYIYEVQDTEPPVLEAVAILDLKTVELYFNEQISQESAETVANYQINNNIEVVTAQLKEDLKNVRLTTSTHQPDVFYTITVNNIQDRATPANSIAANTTATYQLETVDNTPPELLSAQILSATKVALLFSEPISKTSAENVQHYAIDKGIQVVSATLETDLRTVNLTTAEHSRGESYTVTVTDIFDLASTPNKIQDKNQATYYYKIVDMEPPEIWSLQVVSTTELVISFTEPVEKNSAEEETNYVIDKGVSVLQATLDNSQMVVNLKTTAHQVGEQYIITLNNIADLAPIPNKIKANTAYAYHLPASDEIKPKVLSVNILDKNSVKILFSKEIEKNSAENVSHYQINKGIQIGSATLLADQTTVLLNTSEHRRGETYLIRINGIKDTAAMPNEIEPNTALTYHFGEIDNQGPTVLAIIPHSETQLEIEFSEQLYFESAEEIAHYQIDKGVKIYQAKLDNNLKTVYLTTSIHTRGVVYTIEFNGIEDLSGQRNQIAPHTTRSYFFEVQDYTPPAIDSVRIWDQNYVSVYFNEPIDRNGAENRQNYLIDQGVVVRAARLDYNKRIVHLATTSHQRGLSYRLVVNNIYDLASNPNEIAANTSYLYNFESVDTTPPTIVTINVISMKEIEVIFSERINRFSAEQSDNYKISNNVEVLSATLDSSELVVSLKTIRHNLQGRYILTVNNIFDQASIPNPIKANSCFSYQIEINSVLKNISLNHYLLDSLSVGGTYYVDRAYRIMELPESKQKLLWLKTANSDRWRTDEDFLSFQVETNVKIFVGYDSRALSVPTWLEENFVRTNQIVRVSDLSHYFTIWEQASSSGNVILGGNMASGANGAKAMYTVMIESAYSNEGFQPDPGFVPQNFQLYQNYPNPFNGGTKIRFDIPGKCRTKLVIYNLLGQTVTTLIDNTFEAGRFEVAWEGLDDRGNRVANGVYFARLQIEPIASETGENNSPRVYQAVKKLAYMK